MEDGDSLVGYAIVDDAGTLLELFYEDAWVSDLDELFRELAAAAAVRSGLCQSFDPNMMALAVAVRARVKPVGILFRTAENPSHAPRSDVAMRPASRTDLKAIVAIDDGFFADEDEIRGYLDIGGLFALEGPRHGIVGCGVAAPVLPDGTDIDIGMLVGPDFRRQGYGTFIVSYLKAHLISNARRPICGCAIENIGSQRAIQKAGFSPDHRLLLAEY